MRELENIVGPDLLKKAAEEPKDIYITVHFNEAGAADCVCAGSLCVAAGIATEEELGCRRMRWLFLEDVTDSEDSQERELRQDNPVSMFKRPEED